MRDAVKELIARATTCTDPIKAMQFTQAALNAANAIAVLTNTPKA